MHLRKMYLMTLKMIILFLLSRSLFGSLLSTHIYPSVTLNKNQDKQVGKHLVEMGYKEDEDVK